MMKKRLLAFGLAGVMLMGMSMNVFAAETESLEGSDSENPSTLEKENDANVTYIQPQSYTVVIPSEISVSNAEDKTEIVAVRAAKVNLIKNNVLKITAKKADITMTGKDRKDKNFSMELYAGETLATSDVLVASWSTSDDINAPTLEGDTQVALSVKKKDGTTINQLLADEYSGSITYNISVTSK